MNEKDRLIDRYKEELYHVYTSRSWRYTAPFRKAVNIVRNFAIALHMPRIRKIIKNAYFLLPMFVRNSRMIESLKNKFKSTEDMT